MMTKCATNTVQAMSVSHQPMFRLSPNMSNGSILADGQMSCVVMTDRLR